MYTRATDGNNEAQGREAQGRGRLEKVLEAIAGGSSGGGQPEVVWRCSAPQRRVSGDALPPLRRWSADALPPEEVVWRCSAPQRGCLEMLCPPEEGVWTYSSHSELQAPGWGRGKQPKPKSIQCICAQVAWQPTPPHQH